jgi:hypothetical protein
MSLERDTQSGGAAVAAAWYSVTRLDGRRREAEELDEDAVRAGQAADARCRHHEVGDVGGRLAPVLDGVERSLRAETWNALFRDLLPLGERGGHVRRQPLYALTTKLKRADMK